MDYNLQELLALIGERDYLLLQANKQIEALKARIVELTQAAICELTAVPMTVRGTALSATDGE